MRNKIASLEILNNRMYIMPTLSFLDSIVRNHANLDVSRYERLRYVVAELLKARIDNSYPDSRGQIYVELYLTHTYFEVSIKDKGVPGWYDFSYDESLIVKDKNEFRNFIIDSLVDNIGMEKLGKEGQRVYVQLRIKNPIQYKRPEPHKEEEVLDTNISIRPVITHEDAIEAIRCIYSEYGYSYAYERLYYIDSFMQMIKNGEIMSFLAVNDHGQIAGHFALAFSELYTNMPEISTVVILKEFRGLGLFAKFIDYCLQIAKEHSFRALMGQPVAFHPMSQKAFLKSGFTATSLLMSYLGSDLESEYNQNKERLNLCVSVRVMDDTAYSKIYPPKELCPFIDKVYNRLGWRYEICEDSVQSEHTVISIENNESMRLTKILLGESSDDLEKILQGTINDSIRRKNEMIELAIVMGNPSCEYGYSVAKKCGFAVSGVIPGGENNDYLIMQIIVGDKMNYDDLVMVGEFEELKDCIAKLNQ